MTEETSETETDGEEPKPERVPFWKAKSKFGRRPKFEDAEQLWIASLEYFAWVDANPLMSSELVKFHGAATIAEVPKMRAMTIGGLCLFLDIDRVTWKSYAERGPEFLTVVTAVEEAIREQKFAGAAADMLNANIIARDLGLVDKKEHSGLTVTIASGDADL